MNFLERLMALTLGSLVGIMFITIYLLLYTYLWHDYSLVITVVMAFVFIVLRMISVGLNDMAIENKLLKYTPVTSYLIPFSLVGLIYTLSYFYSAWPAHGVSSLLVHENIPVTAAMVSSLLRLLLN